MEVKGQSILKRKRGIDTTNRILETAAQLFARKGYDNVSLREIAEGVGVKESSLYNHFESKQAILDSLFKEFAVRAPLSRPSDDELEKMMTIMSLQDILKNIIFYVGRNIDSILENTAIIIQCEKFRNALAAEAYYQYLINEPALYYEGLINKMTDKKLIKCKDARTIVRQYSYAALAVSQEYFMAKQGNGTIENAVARMLETMEFYCSLIDS